MAVRKVEPKNGELVEALLAGKLLNAKDADAVRKGAEEEPFGVVTALAKLDLVTDEMLPLIAEHESLRVVDLSAKRPDPAAARLIDGTVARLHSVLPVGFDGDRLVLAMADPAHTEALDEVAVLTGLLVEPALAARAGLHKAIDDVFGPDARSAGGEPEEVRKVGKRLGVGEDVLPVDVHELLEQVLLRGASDLHLTGGIPPTIRLHGDLRPMDEYPVLHPEDLQKMIYGILTQKQRERFENQLELDFAYALPGKARFRVNVYMQRASLGAAFRLIPFQIKSVQELGLPTKVTDFAYLPRGLVVVTGPTGSGKSTTLASIVDIVNSERAVHIMTVEDPIEFLHTHKTAVVNQREVGADTHGFAEALKHVLRQDPDVILVGEMRDLETIHMAITAAETGHLVFGTLHTQDAPQTIDRIIDVFPPHQQQQIRVQLAGALQGVVAQQLIQTRDGTSRVAACEVLLANSAVRNLVREAKTHQIYSVIQSGGNQGMQSMDAALADLVKHGKITLEAARERCHNAEELARLAQGAGLGAGAAAGKVKVLD